MSKKTTSTSKPWKAARPFILGAAQAGQDTWNANRGNIQSMTDQVTGLYPGMVQDYQAGDSGINAARNYNTRVLGGEYLNQGNPHLDAMIQQTGDNTRNSVQSSLGRRMLTGGSDYAKIMAREMGKQELGMRYQDYDQERARMATAAGQAPGIAAGDAARLQPLLATLGASMTPMQAASGYMGSLGGLLGQYQTQTQSQGLGQTLSDMAGRAMQAAAMSSDIRLKEDIRRVGTTDAGLPVYTYRYKGSPQVQMGVMAQDVEAMQPGAIGPDIGGFKSVMYGEVR